MIAVTRCIADALSQKQPVQVLGSTDQPPEAITNRRISFIVKHVRHGKIGENAEFVRGLNAGEFEKLITQAANGDLCLELVFFVASDSLLREINKMAGPTLNTFEVGGYLEYWRLNGDAPGDLPVKGTGLLRRALRQGCP